MNKSSIKQENYEKRPSERPHILVVDDDRRIRDLLMRYLGEHGFIVMSAQDASEAQGVLAQFEFDALVVDVMMPGKTGLEFVAEMRSTNDIPVLMLTALGEPQDRISGLEVGADDYLAKPFEPRELILRLKSLLKRTAKKDLSDKQFLIGPWVFMPASETLEKPGSSDEAQKLTSVEVALIKALASKPGEVFTREDLARMCGIDAGERTFDVQVTRLRRKIEEDTKNPRYLLTIRGKGYLLRAQEA